MRRKIYDLLASLPHPSDHTPPRVPHPPSTKRRSRPRRVKDRKSTEDKEQEIKGKETEEDEEDDIHVQSSLALVTRDSLIFSRERMSRQRVSTPSLLQHM